MKWYRKLYTGESARSKRFRIVSRVKHGRYMKDVFLITLASNPKNLLDIYPGYIYLQPYFQEQDQLILGIALGKDEAFAVAQKIIEDVYGSTGAFGVQEYFEPKAERV